MEGNMKTTKRFKAFLLLILCVALVFPRMDSSAARSAQYYQAMKAYKTWLGRKTVCVIQRGQQYYDDEIKRTYSTSNASDVKFALAYLDNDGIPELIISTKQGSSVIYGILTFKNGKLYRAYNSRGNGYFGGYYYKTGYFLENIYGGSTEMYRHYNRLSKTEVQRMVFWKYDANARGQSATGKQDRYYVNRNKVSKSAFMSKLQSATKGKTKSSIKLYQNTAANRDKILK